MKLPDLGKLWAVLMASPSLGARNVRAAHRDLPVARTPRVAVHRERAFTLFRFEAAPGVPTADAPPVLLVPSLINRWYVMDLLPGHSLVEALLGRGLAVYVAAWNDAHDGQGGLPLAAWVDRYLDRAVRRCLQHAGAARLAMLGQCLGGTLALAYAATRPDRLARLVTLTTPVDFSADGLLRAWADPEVTDVTRLAASFPGRLPNALVYGAFPLLNPRALVTKHRTLATYLENDDFVRLYQALDLWTSDPLAVASGAATGVVETLYQRNALWNGGWRLESGTARLEDVRCPLLNVVARSDEIVPLASARPLLERVGSGDAASEFLSPMGHVTLILGSPLRAQTWQAIGDFCLAGAGA